MVVAFPPTEPVTEADDLTPERIEALLEANAADDETQRARLASLKGKHMLFVAGDFVYPACAKFLCDHLQGLRAHGLYITAIFQQDKKKAYYDACRPAVDAELFADLGASNGAENAVAAVREAGLELDGVWSPHEAVVLLMSRIAALLKLPGNPPSAYEVARDKFATREALKEANINSIKAVQIWDVEDADLAAREIGFPMIVKPSSGMGSAGVYRVDDNAELRETLERVFADIDSSWGLKVNHGAVQRQAPVLAETCVLPNIYGGRINEFDVEVVLNKGELVYSNVLDNLEALPYTYQELGSIAPSLSPREVQEEMIQYAAAATRAMGFHTGAFHVETWMTPSGPILIENNPRVGGGATVDTHINVWGVNPMLEFTLAMLDIPINPPRAEEPFCVYGYILPNAPLTGAIADKADFLDETKKSPYFKTLNYFKKPKEAVKGLDTRLPDWIGEVHLRGNCTGEEMLAAMGENLDLIHDAAANCIVPAGPEAVEAGPEMAAV
ncbi:Carnosine synthase 1 [Hondaea fermentalgiana]|uniref:Carnosine synthase 1 n=1 Tax=Hondaea fermentalgiana TaxID=2315210 RepID=A0A2R5GP50_9STRA|nr:Carnosine synthase 1 [Hondaea fermentalgiana]|eukprot:GBG32656.1 Carnosine synthase 1 [Hondaea fermentalgiana]